MSQDLDLRIDRLVALLARADGCLEGGVDPLAPPDAAVVRIDTGDGLKRTRLTSAMRAALLQRGWIEIAADAIRLTAAGRAHAARGSAHPQAFRLQHGAVAMAAPEPGEAGGVLIDAAESPLAWLHRRKAAGGVPMVDAAEFAAGERLRLDFTKGGLMPTMTSNWRDMALSGGGRGGRADLTDAALAARGRVTRALAAIGPELSGIAVDVCCFLKGLETVESDRQWPQRSAKVVLKLALQALARHYGIGSAAVGAPGHGRSRHWGSADFRPKIGGEP